MHDFFLIFRLLFGEQGGVQLLLLHVGQITPVSALASSVQVHALAQQHSFTPFVVHIHQTAHIRGSNDIQV
jgi:hypothetical protein